MDLSRVFFFRKKLLDSIGFNQANSKSLKILSENIQLVTGNELSYNTLRRFFGLLKTTSPSTKTWKTLQEYLKQLGEKNHNNHLAHVNYWKPYNDLYVVLRKNDSNQLINYLESISEIERFPQILGTLICQLIAVRNKVLLSEVISVEGYYGMQSPQTEFTAQFVCEMLNQMSLEDLIELEDIFTSPTFKEKVFYSYIDYGGLNGYYGFFLEKFKPENTQEEIFLTCILGYRAYLNGQSLPEMKRIPFSVLAQCYSVLVGRYIGYQIIYYPQEAGKIITLLVTKATEKFHPHELFIEIFPALLFIKDFRSIQLLIDKYYESIYEIWHWNSYCPYNHYLIGEALLYLYEGDRTRAEIIFHSIHIDKTSNSYYEYSHMFYLVLAYQIKRGDEAACQQILKEYNELAIKTGFIRFSEDFITGYFNWS
jgi:hypothetical protein